MKLHWSPKSPFVRKVMVCAHELGVTEKLTLVRSVAAMQKPNPQIMADNPLSKIPTLVLDDGRVMYDSVVICEYLDDLAGGSLFPRVGEARWQALQWHALGNGLLDALILWRNERERDAPLQVLLDAFALKMEAVLEVLEKDVDALRAAPLNIGGVTIGCALGYADYRFDALRWRDRAPRLADWFQTLGERPSFVATRVVDG